MRAADDFDAIRQRMQQIALDRENARMRCTQCGEALQQPHATGCGRYGNVVAFECAPAP